MSEVALREAILSLDWSGATRPMSLAETDVRRAAEHLGENPLRWVSGAVEAALTAVRAEDNADLMAPWQDVRMLAEAVLTRLLIHLVEGGDEPDSEQLVVHPGMVSDLVGREIEPHQINLELRVMQRTWLRLLVDHMLTCGAGAAALTEVVGRLTGTIDHWVEVFMQTILAERRRTLDSAHARGRAAVEAVVEGRELDADVAQQLLGVSLEGWHVACVVGARPGAVIETREVTRVATSFARVVGSDTPLRYETSTGQVWLWSSSDRPLPAPAAADLTSPAPLVVGVGMPHQGLAGMRRTHLEALDALRLGLRAEDTEVVCYSDVALAAVLSQDEERARWFVEHELGGLCGLDDPADERSDLRATLRTFYLTRMRIAPAADLLFVHRNTLINRLERVERLLHHKVSDRTAEVQAALLLHDIIDVEAARRE